ncbi:MAG TPA: hypothetical protein VMJ75_29580 [Candidatus Acidoferrales bacterium]|nr:hypothetical protein [Candidatus Acidoferrales bacterium]
MALQKPFVAVLVCFGSAAGASAQSMGALAVPTQPPALTALNNAFRASYADAKIRVLASSGPTLIVNGDNFALLRSGRRVDANVQTPIYDPVKTIAHIPLAIYVTLTPGDGAVDADRLKTLAGLRELIPPAEASLDAIGLSAASLARQEQIVAASLAFLDSVIGGGKLERSRLLAFTRGMAPLVMENVAEATRAQLDAVHARVSMWRRDLSVGEWNRLHVLIIGPHMPREDLVVTQYFLRLLHEPREGRRVVYAESLWEEPKALDLLGTHLLDGSVGEAFFGDYMRMHRDLLGDAARQYLARVLPE